MMRKIITGNSGITLVEIMIAMVLSVIVMGAVYMAYQAQQKNARVQEQVAVVQQDLRAAVAAIERDIHNAGCNPLLKSTITPMTEVTSTAKVLNLTMDYTSSGVIDARDENVTYSLSGTDLIRQDNTPTSLSQTLACNVTTLGFEYLDESGNPITASGATVDGLKSISSTDMKDIRAIQITIGIRSDKKDPDTGDYVNRSITRVVRGRNMGLN